MAMKLVYIAGPYTSDPITGDKAAPFQREINVQNAWRAGIKVAQMGAMPIIPQVNTAHMDGARGDDYSFWLEGTLETLRRCDATFLLYGWDNSNGSRGEAREALKIGQPIFESLSDLRQWLKGTLDPDAHGAIRELVQSVLGVNNEQ